MTARMRRVVRGLRNLFTRCLAARRRRQGCHRLVGKTSCKDASASRRPLCVASDTGRGRSRFCCVGECSGVLAVLTVTAVAFNPMDRAASRSWVSASRTLACQIGESTRKTSCSPRTLANRQRVARWGGNRGRNCRSSASSHKARRKGSPAFSPSAASMACCGAEGLCALDLGLDMTLIWR